MKQIIAGQLEAFIDATSATHWSTWPDCPIKGVLCPQLIWLRSRPNVAWN